MEPLTLHKNVFKVLYPVVKPAMKLYFNYTYEPLPELDGPYLLLCNHNTDLDCILAGLAAKKQLYFVATENVVRMGLLGKLVVKYFDPIIHYKGVQGIATTKNILAKLRSGSSVGLFPEGNRSFSGRTCPIPSATGKMARSSGAYLITYRFSGGYFSWPRWGVGRRRGKLQGKIAGVYSPQQLKEMTPAQVNQAIVRDLYADAYADQQKDPIAYKGKTPAEALESTIFICPKCKRAGGLHSKIDHFFCDCGFDAVMDPYGYLHEGADTYTVTQLDEAQKEWLQQNLPKEPSESLFTDKVTLQTVDADHRIADERTVTLTAYADRLTAGTLTIPYEQISGMAINQRNLLLVHLEGRKEHLQCKGPVSFNALKYLYLYRLVCPNEGGVL
ncbi:MAG: 1-acyl-sn-glycerol-3-phosphate acyltransferase [Firmicutes bacterium]|nr:1-acyl-sn-glycerol-3-phosphate acyltransferase [Bacillota bacterium]